VFFRMFGFLLSRSVRYRSENGKESILSIFILSCLFLHKYLVLKIILNIKINLFPFFFYFSKVEGLW
jgi:hypothetical protein